MRPDAEPYFPFINVRHIWIVDSGYTSHDPRWRCAPLFHLYIGDPNRPDLPARMAAQDRMRGVLVELAFRTLVMERTGRWFTHEEARAMMLAMDELHPTARAMARQSRGGRV